VRLTGAEKIFIIESFMEVFKEGQLYLFGSRCHDDQKGGDIDLYIMNHKVKNVLEKKIDFLVSLKQKIGDQKIDVIMSKDPTSVIEQEALKTGQRLC
jgi:hypothetical protein